jgi:hypothetical protein
MFDDGTKKDDKQAHSSSLELDVHEAGARLRCTGDSSKLHLSMQATRGKEIEHQWELTVEQALKLAFKVLTNQSVGQLLPHVKLPRELDPQITSDSKQRAAILKAFKTEYQQRFGSNPEDICGVTNLLETLEAGQTLSWGNKLTVRSLKKNASKLSFEAHGPIPLSLIVDALVALVADPRVTKQHPDLSVSFLRRWGEKAFDNGDLRPGIPQHLDNSVTLTAEDPAEELSWADLIGLSDTDVETGATSSVADQEVDDSFPLPIEVDSPSSQGEIHVRQPRPVSTPEQSEKKSASAESDEWALAEERTKLDESKRELKKRQNRLDQRQRQLDLKEQELEDREKLIGATSKPSSIDTTSEKALEALQVQKLEIEQEKRRVELRNAAVSNAEDRNRVKTMELTKREAELRLREAQVESLQTKIKQLEEQLQQQVSTDTGKSFTQSLTAEELDGLYGQREANIKAQEDSNRTLAQRLAEEAKELSEQRKTLASDQAELEQKAKLLAADKAAFQAEKDGLWKELEDQEAKNQELLDKAEAKHKEVSEIQNRVSEFLRTKIISPNQ